MRPKNHWVKSKKKVGSNYFDQKTRWYEIDKIKIDWNAYFFADSPPKNYQKITFCVLVIFSTKFFSKINFKKRKKMIKFKNVLFTQDAVQIVTKKLLSNRNTEKTLIIIIKKLKVGKICEESV